MRRCKVKALMMVVIMVFVMTAEIVSAQSENPVLEISGEGMAADFFVLRPVGLAVTAIGCALYMVSFPFTIWSKTNHQNAVYYFVVEPASYTFTMPLGDFRELPKRH